MEVKAGYKQTEVGVIPEDWEYLYVDELKNSSENALSTGPFGSSISSKFFQKTGIPVIRGSNLSTDGATRLKEDDFVFVSEEKAFEFRRSCVFPGDLIFTCWGTINQVGLIEVNSSYSQYVISNKQMKLTPLSRIADSVFLFYLFSSSEIQQIIVNQSIGSSIPGFNLGQLRSMRLRIPPLPEQEAIAEALTDADTLIASLEQLIAKKRSLKQGAMQALLTGQQRLPGFEVKPGYQQTEVGLIPEDWDMTEIGNLISDFRGGAPLKPSDFIDSGVKVLPKGGVGRSGWLKINPLDLQFCSMILPPHIVVIKLIILSQLLF